MTNNLITALFNGAFVLLGLFLLWSVVGGMKHTAASVRLKYAAVAGAFSAIVTLAVAAIA